MGREMLSDPGPASPLDPFIQQALRLIATRGDIPVSALASVCGDEFHWLPGFSEAIVTVLRTNRLITVNQWEPGKLHISDRGERWVAAREVAIALSQ